MEEVISKLFVDPQDDSVVVAEVQQRRGWLETLTQDQIQYVDTLVRQKWQMTRSSGPAWVCNILPAEPPAEFWSA